MSESGRERWVWDLYPLAKDSWGVWEVAPEMPRPDHRIYMYRMQYDGYMGPVTELEDLHRIEPPRLPHKTWAQVAAEKKLQAEGGAETPQPFGKAVYREAFEPKDDDFALLAQCYPGDDPHRPDWYRVKADLEAAGHDGDRLVKSEAPVLLAWLRQSRQVAQGSGTKDGRKLWGPLLVWSALFVAIAAAVAYCAWLWGQGDNLWQKILASWPYLAVDLAVCLGGFLLHSGKAGRQLVKRWKGED